MEKLKSGISLIGLGAYYENCLIISDIHIGYEEALNKQGILIPRLNFEEIIKNIDGVFSELGTKKIEKIIINGDLKHEFGKISDTEWRHTLRFLDYISGRCNEIILVTGNHDKIIGPIARKRNLEIKKYEITNDLLVIHGDEIIDNFDEILKKNKIKKIIIGHEHPAISFRRESRIEKYKCFLEGKWKKYDLIVLPSFNPAVEGSDVLKEELFSQFLSSGIGNFNVYAVEDKTYSFGKLKNLR